MTTHITPRRTYVIVYLILLALLAVSYFVAFVGLGVWNAVLAVIIAFTKGALILVYFMHLRQSSRLTWVFAGAGFFWLLVLIILMLSDYLSRIWIAPID